MTTALTRQAKIDAISQRCVEANPGIVARMCDECSGSPKVVRTECLGYRTKTSYKLSNPPIRLADVLLACQGAGEPVGINFLGWFFDLLDDEASAPQWDLHHDSLTDQNDATI